ncbi:MAG: XisI protein [Gemmataceae bacterium]|nr:XisI protein [Gemmataceae bacterium]
MDRVDAARTALGEIVRRRAGHIAKAIGEYPGVETVTTLDPEHDQFGLFRVGWREERPKRVLLPVFFARIKDGKVWIEEDDTDPALAELLLDAGVRREDIVLGFLHPDERRYSDFAVA